MLRKILNIVIVLVIVGAISIVFINLYNSSKLEDNNFETTKEETSEKNSFKNKKETTKETNTNDSNEENNEDTQTQEENSATDEENSETSTEDESTSNISGSEVAVASTSSFKNKNIQIIGSIVLIIGVSTIIIKTRKI